MEISKFSNLLNLLRKGIKIVLKKVGYQFQKQYNSYVQETISLILFYRNVW